MFDKIVCLTLDKRVVDGCKERISAKFNQFGLDVTFFVVGDGKTLPLEQYNRVDIIPPSNRRGYPAFVKRPNSYNAFLSFQQIIREGQREGLQNVLLLEDDVDLTDNFMDVLSLAHEQIQEGNIEWDMLYLGANHTWAKTKEVSPNLLRVYGSGCFHAVALSNRVFGEVLYFQPECPIDELVSKTLHHKYNCYAVWPNIALQKDGYSYCEGNDISYMHHFVNKGKNIERNI